jgi:hypothetical protein
MLSGQTTGTGSGAQGEDEFMIGRETMALVLLCALTSESFAVPIQLAPQPNNPDVFKGIQTTGTIRPVANYRVAGVPWQTTTKSLVFDPAGFLEAQGNENPWIQTLNLFGNGWTFGFNTTAVIADNTVQVHTYDAQAPFPPASNSDAFAAAADLNDPNNFFTRCGANNNCVGAEFYFGYRPTGDDPTVDVRWIQVVFDNFENAGSYSVDNGGTAVPYYGGAANANGFLDIPGIPGPGNPHTFDALLLLVTGPATPGKVTIYGGVEWGWSNQPTPAPATLLLLGSGLAGLALRGLLRRKLKPTRKRIGHEE